MPLVALAIFLIWGWHRLDLLHSVSGYGDILEFTWALSWFDEAIRTGKSLAVYPLAFYPGGWHVATYAEGPLMLLATLPLYRLGGPAFAYNMTVLLTFVVAFAGAYKLARLFLVPFRDAQSTMLPATLAALLISFWGLRWFQNLGHPNFLIGSALLPWMLWALERALQRQSSGLSGSRIDGRSLAWLAAAGVLWAVTIAGTVYFVWIGGVALGAWVLGRLLGRSISVRLALIDLAVPIVVALVLSAPGLIWFWQATTAIQPDFYTADEVNFWGASLNGLPIPSIDHPVLGSLARRIYQGMPFEQGATNLGLLAVLVAIAGWISVRKDRRWLPATLLAVAGLLLALGLTLKWNNESLQLAVLRPLNQLIWRIGYAIKPEFFVSPAPQAPFADAVPLPGLLLAALVPFFERARVFARYAFVGGIGVYLLAARGVMLPRKLWMSAVLSLLLVFEVLPAPLQPVPLPTVSHPAFDWLKAQPAAPDQSVVDLIAGQPYTPVLFNGGETVWATRYHGWPTVSGASSVWPAYTSFLHNWLGTHEHTFWNQDTVPILRFYDVRYLLLHMRSEQEQAILEEAQSNQELRLVDCFPAVPGPWNYPICVLEVLPPRNANINLVLQDGWSGQEDWGVWAEGVESTALWVAMARQDHRLQVEAFPQCVDGQQQTIAIEVNGVAVGSHTWSDCDPWVNELAIPAGAVRLGRNDLVIRSAYSARPIDSGAGRSDDTRSLSAGYIRLRVEPSTAQ